MKKIFVILVAAMMLASCAGRASKSAEVEVAADSTEVAVDSTAAAVDSVATEVVAE